jgi:diguanylate cyclase (GGDEF)-like protein
MAKQLGEKTVQAKDKEALNKQVSDFCAAPGIKHRKAAYEGLVSLFRAFAFANEGHKQLLGDWSAHLLQALIPNTANLRHAPDAEPVELIRFLIHMPYDENSDDYKALLQSIDAAQTKPLEPKEYLTDLQICSLIIEFGSSNVQEYLQNLKKIIKKDSEPSPCSLAVRMLEAITHAVAGKTAEEQLGWLELVLNSWMYLDKKYTVYFITRWINSLRWIKSNPIRKELLISLLEAGQYSGTQNLAVILYELFNLSDKAISTGEKLNYLSRMLSLPKELFRVDQLQSMYYFSGNMKSSIESSFMDSVTDFQQSNYYIYRSWCWINSVSHFFQARFSPEEFIEMQSRIEQKTMELINLINIQSNAYVETLQSNFTKIEELYHQVEELSLRDTLTGLYNRRFLYNNINELLQLAVRQQSPLSFVLIDIDDFKPVNDTYGHLAGDYILKDMSNHLKGFFRKSDFVIRYGGEEFLIVMFNSDHMQAEQTLENLRNSINSRVLRYMNTYLHITVSVGIASCRFDSNFNTVNLEKLIAEADAAMYDSKTHGKNRITSRLLTSC